MEQLDLTVYDYNYSSWSMRAGVLLRHAGLPFRERVVHLGESTRSEVATRSPSKLLPVLEHGELRVWESLAIAEYVAELCPEQPLWPRSREARALARAASAEMHAGFSALRTHMPMNIKARYPGFVRSPAVEQDVQRIKLLWAELRRRCGEGGIYLCGEFGIVDCMFAPVLMRFRSYDVALEGVCAAYAEAMFAQPAVQSWVAAAQAETTRLPQYEYVR